MNTILTTRLKKRAPRLSAGILSIGVAAWAFLIGANIGVAGAQRTPPSQRDLEEFRVHTKTVADNRERYRTIRDLFRDVEGQEVLPTDKPARLTMKELHDGQTRWRGKLHSLKVGFDLNERLVNPMPIDAKSKKEGIYVEPGYWGHYDFVMKGDKILVGSQTAQAVAARKHPSQSGAQGMYTIDAYNGAETRTLQVNQLVGMVNSGRDRIDDLSDGMVTLYRDAIGLPHKLRSGQDYKDTPFYVPALLDEPSPDGYTVSPFLELVDSQLCHVVSNDLDTLWIDDSHGFCLRRRVEFSKNTAEDPGNLGDILIAGNVVNLGDGIWLPRSYKQLAFANVLDPPVYQNKPHNVITLDVTELCANCVDDSVFNLRFPPGTKVKDFAKGVRYTVPIGDEALEEAIKHGKKLLNAPSSRFGARFVVINVVVFAVLLGALFFRSRLRKRVEPV